MRGDQRYDAAVMAALSQQIEADIARVTAGTYAIALARALRARWRYAREQDGPLAAARWAELANSAEQLGDHADAHNL